LAAGAAVDHFGYSAAFLFLAAAAALAFLTFFTLMPETRDQRVPSAERRGQALHAAAGE